MSLKLKWFYRKDKKKDNMLRDNTQFYYKKDVDEAVAELKKSIYKWKFFVEDEESWVIDISNLMYFIKEVFEK